MRSARVFLAGFMLIVCVALMWYQSARQQQLIEEMGAHRESEPILPPGDAGAKKPSSAIQEIDKLVFSQPDEALKKTRELLKASDDTEEKIQASERLKRALQKCFEKRMSEKNFDAAGPLAKELQSLAPDAYETRSVMERWRSSRRDLLMNALNKDDFATADRLLKEAYAESPNDFANNFRAPMTQMVEKRVKLAMDHADYTAVDALFADLISTPRGLEPEWIAEKYSAYLMERYKRDRGDREKGRAHLLEAAPFEGAMQARRGERYLSSDFRRWCSEEWSTMELLKLGDEAFKSAAYERAQAFYTMGHATAEMKVTYDKKGVPTSTTLHGEPYDSQRKMLLERLDENTIKLSEKIAAGKVMGAQPEAAVRLLNNVTNPRRVPPVKPERLVEATQKLAEIEVKIAREHLAAGRVSQAKNVLSQHNWTIAKLWRIDCDKGADPWKDVPSAIVAEINAETTDAKQRVNLLEHRIQSGKFFPPQGATGGAMLKALKDAEEAERLQAEENRILQMLASLQKNPRGVLDDIRPVLRKSKNATAAKRIKDAIENAVRAAQARKDLSSLNDLCGFYVAEIGAPKSDDPFREELRVALKYAADEAKDKPMTRVFLLSLLADALPGDPSAAKAGQEAMDKGLEVMRNTPSKSMQKPVLTMPSLVKGMSVLAVENLTSYHLMVFLDGPERCFVRLNPYRRGSLVIKDGNYVTAVVVTADEVIPYRSETSYKSELSAHNYYIVQQGREHEPPPNAEATGPYTLLRIPPGAGPFSIDAESGMVLPAK
ncbi:MAG TPA: hypothetical protein VEJ63_01235 [Planctomycetota bacterium]|nr:hypothetical protein [Planctomycetota bacterium]